MPDDVRQALERFQRFVERFPPGGVIDADSGFSVADGMLLAGEVELHSGHPVDPDENPVD
jgi:hypothetical protein